MNILEMKAKKKTLGWGWLRGRGRMNTGGKLRISVSKTFDIYVCKNVLMKHILCTVANNINNQKQWVC